MAGIAPVPTTSDDPVSWDYLFVGKHGEAAPGIVQAIDVKRSWDIDKKKAGGSSGHTLTTNGENPMEVTITLMFWESEDNDHLDNELARVAFFIDAVFPPAGRIPDPYDVRHPVLALHKIRALFFEEFQGPTKSGTNQWTIKLTCSNFKIVKRKPATSTPSASAPLGMSNLVSAAYAKAAGLVGKAYDSSTSTPKSPDSGPMPT